MTAQQSVGPRPRWARLSMFAAFVLICTGCDGNSSSGGDARGRPGENFRSEFEELAGPLTDREYREVVQLAKDTCADDEDVFALTYAMLVDGGGPSAEGFRLQVEHFCPDRLDELEP